MAETAVRRRSILRSRQVLTTSGQSMVRKHGSLVHDEELDEASWVAARGAVVGAVKPSSSQSPSQESAQRKNLKDYHQKLDTQLAMPSPSACPPFQEPHAQRLTFDPSVRPPVGHLLRRRGRMRLCVFASIPGFLQMSGMTLGSMIEADQRLRLHEVQMRGRKKLARDAEVWRRYQRDFDQEATYIAEQRALKRRAGASSGSGEGEEG
nr:hypothetical protein CFP56_59704 [Quercus suber]